VLTFEQAQQLHDETRVEFGFGVCSATFLSRFLFSAGVFFGGLLPEPVFSSVREVMFADSSIAGRMLITTDFETGVLLFSATLRTGTKHSLPENKSRHSDAEYRKAQYKSPRDSLFTFEMADQVYNLSRCKPAAAMSSR
jgi:hypothetical protein